MWGLPRGHVHPLLKGASFWHGGFFPSWLYCPAPRCCALFQPGEGLLPTDGSRAVLCGAVGLLPSLGQPLGDFLQLGWALLGPAGTRWGAKPVPSAVPHALAHLYALSRHAIDTPCHRHCSFVFFCFWFVFIFLITNRERKLSSLKVRRDPTVPGAQQHPERHLPECKFFAQSVKLIRDRAEPHQRKPREHT